MIELYVERIRERIPPARRLDDPTVIDSLPVFLPRLIERLEDSGVSAEALHDLAREHAQQRASLPGFTVTLLVTDYAVLRSALTDAIREKDAPRVSAALELVLSIVDESMVIGTEYFELLASQRTARAERALAASHDALARQVAVLETILEAVPEAMYVGTMDGISRANHHALDQLGFSSVEELNRGIGELSDLVANRDVDSGEVVPPDALPFVRALRGERAVRETAVTHRKTGERRIIRGAAAPIHLGKEVIGAVALNVDVTDERRKANELREALARERATREEAQRLNEALEQERAVREAFVAALTHDLRSPLTAAQASADLLVRAANDERRQRLGARVIDNLHRLDEMIRDLLDSTRLRAEARLEGELAPMHLNALVAEVVDDLCAVHGQRFVVRAEADIHGVWARGEMRRLLENLCTNAVKYGAPGAPITITLALEKASDRVQLAVHNEGTPIPPAELDRIFGAFRRTRDAEVSGREGWGIGLSLVRGIAEAHGGDVGVESGPGGTTFRVSLPRDASVPRGRDER